MSIIRERTPVPAMAFGCRSNTGSGKADVLPNSARKETAECFVRQFTHFEWKYLCSYRWFLKDMATAVETDDFSLLQIKAEKALIRARLRRSAKTGTDDLSVCHSTEWYD
jgi:hypothetical protein